MTACHNCTEGYVPVGVYYDDDGEVAEIVYGACPCCGGWDWQDCPACTEADQAVTA